MGDSSGINPKRSSSLNELDGIDPGGNNLGFEIKTWLRKKELSKDKKKLN